MTNLRRRIVMAPEDEEERGALSRVLVPSFRTGGGHQSWRRIAPDTHSGLPIARLPLAEDVGRAAPGIAATRIYSAFLRVGFTMPPMSPPGRWALTPPFHPCLIHAEARPFDRATAGHRRSESLWHFPSPPFRETCRR